MGYFLKKLAFVFVDVDQLEIVLEVVGICLVLCEGFDGDEYNRSDSVSFFFTDLDEFWMWGWVQWIFIWFYSLMMKLMA